LTRILVYSSLETKKILMNHKRKIQLEKISSIVRSIKETFLNILRIYISCPCVFEWIKKELISFVIGINSIQKVAITKSVFFLFVFASSFSNSHKYAVAVSFNFDFITKFQLELMFEFKLLSLHPSQSSITILKTNKNEKILESGLKVEIL